MTGAETKIDKASDDRTGSSTNLVVAGANANPLLPSLGNFGLNWIWMLVLRRWAFMAAVLGLSMALALGWLAYATPLYTASAQILLDTRKHRAMPGQDFVADIGADANAISTEVSLIRSLAVAARVVESQRLDNVPEFTGVVPVSLLSRWRSLLNALAGSSESKTGSGADTKTSMQNLAEGSLPPAQLQAARAVQGGTTVRRVATTFFVEISFTHHNPALTAQIANALVEAYLKDVLEARRQSAQRSTAWLSDRAAQLGQQVQTAERAVADHRSRHGLVSVKPASIGEQQAVEINSLLIAARAQVVDKKGKYDQARGILEGGRIESMAEVMASPVILSLRSTEAGVAREEADLLTRYGPEHPSIIKIRAQRSDLRRQISTELSRVVGSLKTDYDLALAREQALEQSLGETRSDSQPVIRLRELERELNASRVLYEAFLARTKEAEQQSGAPTVEARVVAPALQPSSPTFPNRQGILMLALFGGLGLGIALSFVLDHIENGFLALEQTEKVLQLPVLAMVQHLEDRDRRFENGLVSIPEIVRRKPLSRFGESIRSIRVTTELSDAEHPPKLILVTSALPSEGKTTIVQSMAYSAAGSKRVLLMDCDLRHPSAMSAFDLKGGPGLTELLAGTAKSEDVLVAGPIPNLKILPAGASTQHPPDVLSSEKLGKLLQTFRDEFDLVLIDAPPANLVVDAAILSRLVDKIVFIVHWRTTPKDIVQRALTSLGQPRQKLAGVVLNDVQMKKLAGYSKNYAYYGKKYDTYYS